MQNDVYKLMIANANEHIASQDLNNPKPDDITIFQISEVLALCLSKLKEDVVMDIINYDRPLIFSERVNLFYSIWGIHKVAVIENPELQDITRNFESNVKPIEYENKPIAFYFNMEITDSSWKTFGVSLSKEELKSYIDSGYTDAVCSDGYYSLEQKIIQVMNFQKVPLKLQEIKFGKNNKHLLLNEY